MQNIGFGSKIKFVDAETYNKLPLRELRNKGKFIDECNGKLIADEIIRKNEAYTNSISCCSGGGITKGGEITLFHLIPSNTNIKSFNKTKKVLKEKSGAVKINGPDFNGLIIGGKSAEIREKVDHNNYWENSKILFDKVLNFYKGQDISPTIFWGHTRIYGGSNIFYSGKEDTWYINNVNRKGKINDIHSLKEAYDIIKISDKDKKDGIWINNKKLTTEEIAKIEQERATPQLSEEETSDYIKKIDTVYEDRI